MNTYKQIKKILHHWHGEFLGTRVLLLVQLQIHIQLFVLLVAHAGLFDTGFEDLKINFFCRINKLSSLLEDQNSRPSSMEDFSFKEYFQTVSKKVKIFNESEFSSLLFNEFLTGTVPNFVNLFGILC
jgi:hypothetical protein